MKNKYNDMPIGTPSNNFIEIMAENVLSKLDGSHPDFSRLEVPDKPSKGIILGTLGDSSKDYSVGIGTERTLTSVKNNSMSVKFLARGDGILKVKPSLSLYYRVYPTWEEERSYVKRTYDELDKTVELARIWKKHECHFEEISFNLTPSEHPLDFKPFIHQIKSDKSTYKTGG
mgnify:CR=1 FL=1